MGGALLLVLALLAAVVMPGLNGRRIAGAASRPPPPEPPKVGDCLVQVGDSMLDHPQMTFQYATGTFGTCKGQIAGEVVAMLPMPASDYSDENGRRAVEPDNIERYQALSSDCYARFFEFAGADLDSNRRPQVLPPEDGRTWYLLISVEVLVLGPIASDRRAGSDWLACVAVPFPRERYEGTVREALTSGRLPSSFGSCAPHAEFDNFIGTCTQPFQTQLLGRMYAPGVDLRSQDDRLLNDSCMALARKLMRVDDPTFRGLLIVDGMLDPTNPESSDSALCTVSAPPDRKLTGSLIGIGDSPLPWAS